MAGATHIGYGGRGMATPRQADRAARESKVCALLRVVRSRQLQAVAGVKRTMLVGESTEIPRREDRFDAEVENRGDCDL